MTLPPDGAKALRERAAAGGLATGCRLLSLMLAVGGPVQAVTTHQSVRGDGAVIVEFTDGAIVGTAGRALVEDTMRRFSFQQAGRETAEAWQVGYFNDADRSFHTLLDRHLDALLTTFRWGSPPPVPAQAGLRALRVADAAIRSCEGGSCVYL